MAIQDLMPELLADLRNSASRRAITRRIHLIYEDSIEPEVRVALRRDTKKERKYEQLVTRIPDINMIRKVTDKLARVYNKPAVRKVKTGSDQDQELVDYYTSALSLDSKMNAANKMFEWGRSCALEPYLDARTGLPKLRVLTNYQVRAYSEDPDDPMAVTAVTKIMGSKAVLDNAGRPMIDSSGKPVRVNIYHTYTPEEFMVWTENGAESVEVNPLGRIPLVWLNSSEFVLNSYAPESDINSAVLVPKYYADLFYAMSYSAHSVWAAIDLSLPELLDHDPGAVLDLKTDDDGVDRAKQGRIETIKPTVDVPGALELIKQAVFDMLETRGIKPPQTTASLERPNATAALIENADASSYISQRCSYFHKIEEELWNLIAAMHQLWLSTENNIPIKRSFSSDLKLDIVFGEVKPVEIRRETLENIQLQMSMGLMGDKQALAEIYPHFTEAQIDAWIEEARQSATAQNTAAALPNSGTTAGSGTADNQDNTEQNT